jgi:carbonic anhydrase
VEIDGPATSSKLLPLKVHYKEADVTVRNTGTAIDVAVPPGNFVEVDGERFDLARLELHTPSEHKVAGAPYDFEVQLQHKDAEGKTLIVSVLFEEGASNGAMGKILKDLPGLGETAPETIALDPGTLLPKRLLYYSYEGSLTTPPCTEGVRWLVLTTPVELAAKQVDAFTRFIPFNARPTQPLGGRKVVKSSR